MELFPAAARSPFQGGFHEYCPTAPSTSGPPARPCGGGVYPSVSCGPVSGNRVRRSALLSGPVGIDRHDRGVLSVTCHRGAHLCVSSVWRRRSGGDVHGDCREPIAVSRRSGSWGCYRRVRGLLVGALVVGVCGGAGVVG